MSSPDPVIDIQVNDGVCDGALICDLPTESIEEFEPKKKKKKRHELYTKNQVLTLVCEWNFCQAVFQNMDTFNEHLRDHIINEVNWNNQLCMYPNYI